jgi:hypothetical protein
MKCLLETLKNADMSVSITGTEKPHATRGQAEACKESKVRSGL